MSEIKLPYVISRTPPDMSVASWLTATLIPHKKCLTLVLEDDIEDTYLMEINIPLVDIPDFVAMLIRGLVLSETVEE